MKTLTLSLCYFFLSIMMVSGQEVVYASTIDIHDQLTPQDLSKEHDVSVSLNNERYTIHFNIKHGRKIQTHRAIVGSDKDFNQASFTWISKKKLAIKLFSTTSSDEFELIVFGEGKGSTGMEVDTDEKP